MYKILKHINNIVEETDNPCIVYEFYFHSLKGIISWKKLNVQKSETFLTEEFIAAQQ